MVNILKGSKGGGGGGTSSPAPATRTPDNLRSQDTVEVILGMCEGPIEGLVDGAKSFFIGETPLMNVDGVLNFKDFELKEFKGDRIDPEEVVPRLGGLGNNSAVNVILTQNTPVVRQTQGSGFNAIDVRMVIQRLLRQTDKGTFNHNLTFRIQYKPESSPNWVGASSVKEYASFNGTQTGPDCVGLRVTAYVGIEAETKVDRQVDQPEYEAKHKDYNMRFQYRKLPDGDWVTSDTTEGRLSSYPEYEFSGEDMWRTNWTGKSYSHQFLVDDLEKGEYEVRVVGGKINNREELVKIVSVGQVTVSGKTTSTYVKEYRVMVPEISEKYDIRVTKISPDTDTENFTDISWESFQEIDTGPRSWPGTAVTQLVGKSSNQFSSIPEFKGVYRGLIIKVPTNYDPLERTYTGLWDGTWKMAWTNNPALILYDFITNTEYGMATLYNVNIDKYDIYEAAQWCDELVPDGRGGVQPRYTFNDYITQPRSMKEMAKYIAGVFNATTVDYLNGVVGLRVDKPEDASALFTIENVADETGFEYSYTDMDTRYNDITVVYRNPEMNWAEDRRRVFDQDHIDTYGRVPLDFVAVGCKNTHEARRRAHYKLVSSLTETEMVNFTTNRQASYLNPFEIILISDPDQGYGISGRFKTIAVDRLSATLRDPVYLEAGTTYTLQIQTPEGPLETLLTNTDVGEVYTLEFLDELPANVNDQVVFSLGAEGLIGLPKPYRVLTVQQSEDDPELFSVHAIEVNRNKWNDADNLTTTDEPEYSFLPDPFAVPGPTYVNFEERFLTASRSFELQVEPILNQSVYRWYSGEFELWSRPVGSGQAYEKRDLVGGDRVINHPEGMYEFKVLPASYLGTRADLSSVQAWPYFVQGRATPPTDPQNLRVVRRTDGVQLLWDAAFDLDTVFYEVRLGSSWDNYTLKVTERLKSTNVVVFLDSGEAVTVHIRAVDEFGNYSAGILTTTTSPIPPDNVEEFVATQQGDNINFTFTEVAGSNILYEVRYGKDFESGQFLFQTGSTSHTTLFPSAGDQFFWIKALAPTGLYSRQAIFSSVLITPVPNKNIVAEVDHATLGWPGVRHFMTPEADGSIAVPAGPRQGVYYADVNLGRVFKPRTWLDTSMLSIQNPYAWNEADFPWASPEAAFPWNSTGNLSGTRLEVRLSRFVEFDDSDYIESFPLDGSLTGLGGTSPSESTTFEFKGCRFYDGLLVGDATRVSWDVGIPNEFNLMLTANLTEVVEGRNTYFTLKTAGGEGLEFGFDGSFYVLDSNGRELRCNSGSMVGVYTVCLSQTSTMRSIFVYSMTDDFSYEANIELPPVGAFNKVFLYPNL